MEENLQTLRALIEDLRGHVEMHQSFGVEFVLKGAPPPPRQATPPREAAVQQPAPMPESPTRQAPSQAEPQNAQRPAARQDAAEVASRPEQPGHSQQRNRQEETLLHDIPDPPVIGPDDPFTELREEVRICEKCDLCKERTNAVFGEGDPKASIVFVGEGPGADEDRLGRPFVGRAGKMLTQIIHKGMNLHRHKVYICNIVKCRPPGNRVPTLPEMLGCRPYLMEQLELLKPKVIVALGATAVHGLFNEKLPITKIRGQFREWNGIQVMPTFHPSYLIRNYVPETRRAVWEDVQAVLRYLEQP